MAEKDLPEVERHVSVQPVNTPSFQPTFQDLAESQNFLGTMGENVAQAASNKMAEQLGFESGKKPHGDLMPSLTEFDKTFEKNYHAQANATLSVQGQKLLQDAQIQMGQAARITPDLIDKTHAQLKMGLDKIAEQAPTAIKTNLQEQFDSNLLNHITQYEEKMIRQQRDEEKNNGINGIDVNSKNALDLSMDGDNKAANIAVKVAKETADNLLAQNLITPEEARVYKEKAEQNMINGTYNHIASIYDKQGKLPEFEKAYAEKKLPGLKNLTNEQWISAGQSVYQQQRFIEELRSKQENLDTTKFQIKVALNPNLVTEADQAQLKSQVSPNKFEELHLGYIKAMETFNKNSADSAQLIKNWGDPRTHASATPKAVNKAFEDQVATNIQQGASQSDAEVMVASQAGGAIPQFTDSMKNRLSSNKPEVIEEVSQQIHQLEQLHSANALNGLNEQDMAMYNSFVSIRDAVDPVKAAQEVHDRIYNKTSEMVTNNELKWKTQLHSKKPMSQSTSEYGLITAGISKETFANEGAKTLYGNNLFELYHHYFMESGGDDGVARKMLSQAVSSNYGYTYANGFKEFTNHPIENVFNLPNNAAGVIQEDVYNQLEKKFAINKEAYDKKEVNEYWELVPRTSSEDIYAEKRKETKSLLERGINPSENARLFEDVATKSAFQYANAKPIEAIKHIRNGSAGKKYTILIKSNPFATTTNDETHPIHAGYDLGVNNEDGPRPLVQEAPYLNYFTYDPDLDFIRKNYHRLNLPKIRR